MPNLVTEALTAARDLIADYVTADARKVLAMIDAALAAPAPVPGMETTSEQRKAGALWFDVDGARDLFSAKVLRDFDRLTAEVSRLAAALAEADEEHNAAVKAWERGEAKLVADMTAAEPAVTTDALQLAHQIVAGTGDPRPIEERIAAALTGRIPAVTPDRERLQLADDCDGCAQGCADEYHAKTFRDAATALRLPVAAEIEEMVQRLLTEYTNYVNSNAEDFDPSVMSLAAALFRRLPPAGDGWMPLIERVKKTRDAWRNAGNGLHSNRMGQPRRGYRCSVRSHPRPTGDHQAMSDRPRIITLCGSSRFPEAFHLVNAHFSMQGIVVISLGLFGHVDAPVGARFLTSDGNEQTNEKRALDQLHYRKIDISDGIFVVNVGGYVGSSTRREIAYALSQGKSVEWLFPPPAQEPTP